MAEGYVDIRKAIEGEVKRSPGQSAASIARRLTKRLGRSVSRSDVNVTLYKHPELFQSVGTAPPLWSAAGLEANKAEAIERRVTRTTRRVGAPVPASQWSTLHFARPAVERSVVAPRTRRLYAWQDEALDAWRTASCRGVVEAVTGTGKTMVGVVAVESAICSGGKALVIVPTIELRDQWKRVLQREIPGVRLDLLGGGSRGDLIQNDVVVAVVNSAASARLHIPTVGALVVADECHRYGADWFAKALDPRFEARLGLSATYARGDDKHRTVLDPYFEGTCFSMGYPRAVGDDVTAHFKVALVGVRFTAAEEAEYRRLSKAIAKLWASLVHSYGLPERDYATFMAEVAQLAESSGDSAGQAARAYVKMLGERRKLLSDTPAKSAGLAKLTEAIRAADRTLLFSQTVVGAQYACRQIQTTGFTAATMSSEHSRDARRHMLREFERGRLDVLAAPRVLDEGIDVPEADLAVIVTASRSRRQMVQRMGRVLRRKSDGRMARFALIYVEGTTEDPTTRAHEDFLDDMDGCADGLCTFDSSSDAADICAWLNDMVPAEPFPAPRFAGEPSRPLAGPLRPAEARPAAGAQARGVTVNSNKAKKPKRASTKKPLVVSSGRRTGPISARSEAKRTDGR